MPRSGTTLVEQIISTHSKVFGGDELNFLQEISLKYLFNDKKVLSLKKMEKLYNNNIITKIRDEYLVKLKSVSKESKIITDKHPINFKWIGLIKMALPQSKIIHCVRNPKDNCLSIYKNFFASNDMNWAFGQSDIANYYNLHLNLMDYWKSKLGNFIYEIKYENLVSNKEEEVKKLIKFCHLEWDPICLNHHKSNKTPIKTVSISQARKPVYQSSVNSNLNYENYLSEMFDLL